jgi:hypothetical protein
MDLAEMHPDFLSDCENGIVKWETASDYITGCIRTFMVLIAHIDYNDLTCYCCSYPSRYSADYIVLTVYDEHIFLVSILKDSGFYPNDYRRVQMLKDGLLFLDCAQPSLNAIYAKMALR